MKIDMFQNKEFLGEVRNAVEGFAAEIEKGDLPLDGESNIDLIKGLLANLKEMFRIIDTKRDVKQLTMQEQARFAADLNLFMTVIRELEGDEDFDDEEFEMDLEEMDEEDNSKY